MPDPSNADILAKLIQHDAALAADASELAHLSSRIDSMSVRVEDIADTVRSHSELLRDLQDALRGHGAELTDLRTTLDAHSAMLSDHSRRLTSHGDLLATILATVTRIEGRLAE